MTSMGKWGHALAVFWLCTSTAEAQKLGPHQKYEDGGFAIASPADFEESVLPKRVTDEKNALGFRHLASFRGRGVGRGGAIIKVPTLDVYLFEEVPDLAEIEKRSKMFMGEDRLGRARSFKVDGQEGKVYEGTSKSGFGNLVAMTYGEGRGYVIQYACDERDFDKMKRDFYGSLKSFRYTEWTPPKAEGESPSPGLSVTDKKRYGGSGEESREARDRRIREEAIEGLPEGWWYHDTPHYRILTNAEKRIVGRLGQHLELIIKEYQKRFPPPGGKEFDETFIVRLFAEQNEYQGYGGPPSSAAYFSPTDAEIVGFVGRNENETLTTMYHECMHQYLHVFFGDLSAHRWFDEGWGDYFAGFSYQGGRLKEGANRWRIETIRNAAREGKHVPLDKFVRYTQPQYYADANLCYSQGWAFVYFLIQTNHPKWKEILPTYLRALREAYVEELQKVERDEKGKVKIKVVDGKVIRPDDPGEKARDRAIEAAFSGIDMAELDAAFVDFAKAVK